MKLRVQAINVDDTKYGQYILDDKNIFKW